MSNYTLHQLRSALDKLESENNTVVSIPELETKLKFIPVINSIVQMIKAISNNYISPSLRNELSQATSREAYVEDILPTISLGRRQGHSTAIVELVQNADEEIVVVVPHQGMLREYENKLGRTSRESLHSTFAYNNKVKFITQAHFSQYSCVYTSVKSDPLIIFDCSNVSKSFLIKATRIELTNKFVFVGN